MLLFQDLAEVLRKLDEVNEKIKLASDGLGNLQQDITELQEGQQDLDGQVEEDMESSLEQLKRAALSEKSAKEAEDHMEKMFKELNDNIVKLGKIL